MKVKMWIMMLLLVLKESSGKFLATCKDSVLSRSPLIRGDLIMSDVSPNSVIHCNCRCRAITKDMLCGGGSTRL